MRVFITRKIPKVAETFLRENGIRVKVFPEDRIILRDELIDNCKDVEGIISLLTERFDQKVLDELKNCKIISNYAVGFNNIDVEYAKSKGIVVTNTPDVLTDATSEIAVSLILACARRITESDRYMRDKKFMGWRPDLLKGIQLNNKILGIVGAGRIGRATAQRMYGFGCKIVYFSRRRKDNFEKEFGAKKVSLNKLLKVSDFISIHLPLNDQTYHLLDRTKLELIQESAIIVNTARGEIVEEKYLIKMLKRNRLFAAGFDVYENEPDFNPELLKLQNVVLLPHIGSATIETRDEMAILAAKNIVRVLNGNKALTPVN